MKKIIPMVFGAVLLLQSCSVNSETTYYTDASTSMQSHIIADPSIAMMMQSENPMQENLKGLGTDWKSFYDLQKTGKVVMNADSAKVLKKLFLKLDKANGQVQGLSFKYDKLLPKEVAQLFSQSKQLRDIPLQNIASWDGKSLVIDTQKFSVGNLQQIFNDEKAPASAPKTKQDSLQNYGRQMA